MSYLDTRDLQERLEELQDQRDSLESDVTEAQEALQELLDKYNDEDEVGEENYDDAQAEIQDAREEVEDAEQALEDFDDGELEELKNMVSEIPEWQYGATLIPVDDWVDYCKEMVDDCGYIPKDLPLFLADNIDWNGVADALGADYGEIDYQGETYKFRNC